MSSDVWKIGQETGAGKYFENVQKSLFNLEVLAVKKLTKICEEMSNEFNTIIEDQNEYLIELEEDAKELQIYKNESEQKIETLFAEIKTLEQKEQDGNITEEEQKELEAKKGEFDTLNKDSKAEINSKSANIATKSQSKVNEYKTKTDIALDYGEVTVEKGTPLAETEVKGGFFRKLFGTTGEGKKRIGEEAVAAGNNLLDKANESVGIEKNIDGYKNSVKK